MITSSLYQAVEFKRLSAAPASVRFRNGHFEVVNKFATITDTQRKGLLLAYSFYNAFRFLAAPRCFHSIEFEVSQITQRGPALANELRQMGLLQCHEGRYWISPAGLNAVQSANTESKDQ